jgi:Bacterial regulatory protein, Fis family
MKTWAETRTESERIALLDLAIGEARGNVSRAAAMLGITRQHLHRLLPKLPKGPILAQEVGAAEDLGTLTLTLPRRCIEWLDIEAVKRKHLAGNSKAAKSPIVVELIEREMAARP